MFILKLFEICWRKFHHSANTNYKQYFKAFGLTPLCFPENDNFK